MAIGEKCPFLLLATKAGTIRRSGAVGSWLFGVAHRLALKVKRATTRRRRYETRAAVPAMATQTDDITLRELRAVLDEELALLPDKYRAPLLLCYFQGLTQEEVADRLGWSTRSVKDRLERGRNGKLHVRLTRGGLTLSAVLSGVLLAGRPCLVVGARYLLVWPMPPCKEVLPRLPGETQVLNWFPPRLWRLAQARRVESDVFCQTFDIDAGTRIAVRRQSAAAGLFDPSFKQEQNPPARPLNPTLPIAPIPTCQRRKWHQTKAPLKTKMPTHCRLMP